MQKHDADDSGEMKTSDRNVRDRKHQRAIREAALCPDIVPGKGISSVAFHITDGILEYIRCAIDGKRTVYRGPHTVNAVPALHEGHIPERSHDVIFDWHERTKTGRASDMEIRRVDV